ncbi:MAG: glycosyltransferase family 4 protein [Reyranella sp.]|uniref:glycosyltransferase family 4 protein n=2 Tax=Reyranella sp. TaxID=1929291 RepID=UPI003D11E318
MHRFHVSGRGAFGSQYRRALHSSYVINLWCGGNPWPAYHALITGRPSPADGSIFAMNMVLRSFIERRPRFDRVAITCVFGDPFDSRSWSGAPANLAKELEQLGVAVEAIHPRLGRLAKWSVAARDMAAGLGRPLHGEQLLRGLRARRRHAAQVAESAARLGVRHVIHTGTFDLPAADRAQGVEHYLYCDHSWALAKANHPVARRYNARAIAAYDQAERQALSGLAHVFTFGSYVRDNLIAHYGLPADRVTAVGSGMGSIEPYWGPKSYDRPALLFVAKHLFHAKGGMLLLEAYDLARRRRPDLTLTIVGDERSRAFVGDRSGITFHAHLPWTELQQRYRDATLLVQPMLNDPWGQVYLEAMASATPVMGLNRNGLPELVDGGRHGFLVDRADPAALSEAILSALSDPQRLQRMAAAGRRFVLASCSWRRVAERIAYS